VRALHADLSVGVQQTERAEVAREVADLLWEQLLSVDEEGVHEGFDGVEVSANCVLVDFVAQFAGESHKWEGLLWFIGSVVVVGRVCGFFDAELAEEAEE
jgi:hypothetical protein